jgi:hypothetical protein
MKKIVNFLAGVGLPAVVVCGLIALAVTPVDAQSQATALAVDAAVQQKLDSTVVTFNFSEQPVSAALDFLATIGGINIVPDTRSVEPTKTVTLKLSNVTLRAGLNFLVGQAGLKWTVRDGVVIVGDEEATKQEAITVVYDVRDFLAVPPDYEGPSFDLVNMQSTRGGTSSGSGANTGLFVGAGAPGAPGGTPQQPETSKTADQILQDLVLLIKTVIAPGTWD